MLRVKSYTRGTPKGEYRDAIEIAELLRSEAKLVEAYGGRRASYRLTVKFEPEKRKKKGKE